MNERVWKGYRRIDFTFEGMDAILVFPTVPNGKGSWMLKTEYFGAFPALELEMLARGWHLAYVKNVTRWCLARILSARRDLPRFCIRNTVFARAACRWV